MFVGYDIGAGAPGQYVSNLDGTNNYGWVNPIGSGTLTISPSDTST